VYVEGAGVVGKRENVGFRTSRCTGSELLVVPLTTGVTVGGVGDVFLKSK
jgi:hypothetical protein